MSSIIDDLPPEKLRRVDPELRGDRAFLQRIFCQVMLPYRKPKDDVAYLQRKVGWAEVTIQPGIKDGQLHWPYGKIPRLALIWLVSEIVKTRSREITLGKSIRDFLGQIGYTKQGNNIKAVQTQLEALFGSRVTLAYRDKDLSLHQNIHVASQYKFWWTTGEGDDLFPSKVVVSQEFYDECICYAVPLDMQIIRDIHQNALALDFYIWLSYRSFSINAAIPMTFTSLATQFGGYGGVGNFRRNAIEALVLLKDAWPSVPLSIDKRGNRQIVTVFPATGRLPG